MNTASEPAPGAVVAHPSGRRDGLQIHAPVDGAEVLRRVAA